MANDNLSLTIHGGEIHTILGENGAGKSTLMNILAGMLRPDEGRLRINGQEVTLESPHAAHRHSIGTVYQHFTLVPNLSVIENVILGLDLGFVLNLGRAEQRLHSLLADFGLSVSSRTEVRYLSLGQQQRVEIIKTLFRGSQMLLLDEPTSVLPPPEVRELFAILTRLKAQGIGIVFITHKLDEALEISDRITILRAGKKVGEFGPGNLAQAEPDALTGQIVAAMFGGPAPPL
ncbi:MAG: ATP-binding cassette domain-containing protein [Anaerolineales bacterium]|nr:ATP-binding cassette domain-containing protein [Anaerolineales bacterium]